MPLDTLIAVCVHLEKDTQGKIKPYKCIFERTKKGTGFHYRVPDGKPSVIAWSGLFTRGHRGENKPCVLVGIKGSLLDSN